MLVVNRNRNRRIEANTCGSLHDPGGAAPLSLCSDPGPLSGRPEFLLMGLGRQASHP
jgi:hypothetical protein